MLIEGNMKTRASLIEAESGALKITTSVQELQVATIANARFQKLDIFDSVNISPEFHGTSNVIVDKNPLTGDIGIFTTLEVISDFVTSCDVYDTSFLLSFDFRPFPTWLHQ